MASSDILIAGVVVVGGIAAAAMFGVFCNPPLKFDALCFGKNNIDIGAAYQDILSKTPSPGPRQQTGTEKLCGVLTPVNFNCHCDNCGYCQWIGTGKNGRAASGPRVNGGCTNARNSFLRQEANAGYASYAGYGGRGYRTVEGEHPMAVWQEDWNQRVIVG